MAEERTQNEVSCELFSQAALLLLSSNNTPPQLARIFYGCLTFVGLILVVVFLFLRTDYIIRCLKCN